MAYRTLTFTALLKSLRGTVGISAMILFIILGATTFSQILSFSGATEGIVSTILGGDLQKNAEIIRAILAGERSPRRDVVLMNASATLVAAGRADSIGEAMPLAAQSIDSGAARDKLAALAEFTNRA